MEQTEFGDFGVGGDRPADEAEHVAGNGGETADVVDADSVRFPDADGSVTVTVTQVDYTVEYSGDDEFPVVHIFGRREAGDGHPDLEHIEVYDFEPYFYVPIDNVDDERVAQYDGLVDYRETDAEGEPFESIRGDRLAKVVGRTPRDVGQVRDDFEHYEADILFPDRLLIDKDIESGVCVPERRTDDGTVRVPHQEVRAVDANATPRVNTFDIEVDDRNGFPEDGEQTIVCLTSHDSYRDEYVNWLYRSPAGVDGPTALSEYDPIEGDIDAEVRAFDEETEMLDAFIQYVEETDPDILTGWNFADFDAPYFLDRVEELASPTADYDLDIDRLSRVDEVWRSDWNGPDIKGRVVFDLLRAYKATQFTELESYRLDAVGEAEMGVGKERYPGDIGDLWEDDPERLLEYNLRDVELCVELDRKQDIIAFWDEARKLVGCKIEDAPTAGDAVDMYVLHKAYGEFALPSKGQQDAGDEFEGGAVFDPITGVRENVSVLDLKSLYPMSMTTINASPETKVDPESYGGKTYRTPTGVHFRKEPDGIIREMVDELLDEREQKKALRNDNDPGSEAYERFDRQQAAVKVIMNCFTPDTDVLTPDGVRNIRDLEVGDPVYSLDPETEEMQTKPVVETHAYPDYRGELVDIETSETDFRVTPNHRMLVRKNETNGVCWEDYRFVEAGALDRASNYELPHDWEGPDGEPIDEVDLIDLVDGGYEVWCDSDDHGHALAAEVGWYPDRVGRDDVDGTGYVFAADEFEERRQYLDEACSRFFVRAERGRRWVPRYYDGEDFLELLAWYVTEGSVDTSENRRVAENFRGSATSVSIARDAPVEEGLAADGGARAAVGDLLDRMGVDYYVDDRGCQFTSKLLGEFLEGTCGADSFEKRVPEFVFETSREQKRRFLGTLVDGDADRQRNSWRYSTASERLRDDVLRLCAHLGLTANYTQDNGETWRIHVTEDPENTLGMDRDASRSEAEDGVYCVTVEDNHTLMAGRGGKFQFVGQSLYGVFGWDRFRLYDREMSAGVTSTNREVISFTEQAANELDKEVIYGDSVTGDRPVVVRDPAGSVQTVPIADIFERASEKTDSSVVVTADGGVVSGASDPKDRRTLDGWEALSLSDTGESEWQPIEQVIRHRTDKDVVKLQHEFGESVTTRDHAYVVERADGYGEASPSEVQAPLRIPDVPAVDEQSTIDVYEVLSGYTREDEHGRGVGSEGTERKTKRVHADDQWVWFGHEHHREQSKTVRVRRHVDLESADGRALVRLLAAYVSRGKSSTVETTSSRFGASISEGGTEWLEELREEYDQLFDNTTASIVSSDSGEKRTVEDETGDETASATDGDGTQKLQMTDELAGVFFREFAGQTARGKRVPSFVFHLPAEMQDRFLEVLVEGDGSPEFPRYSGGDAERTFDFETPSEELAGGLSTLLTQRGRKHSLRYRDGRDSYTVRTCTHYRRGRDPVVTEVEHDGHVYDLSVAENGNFVDAVGGVVLHNTDSVMLELGGDTPKDEAIERSFEIEEHINERYDEFAREELNADVHRFQIEFEKLYRRFFQAGKKKRYAGHIVWSEGKDVDDIDITGFEYQRSDIAPITKDVQLEVIEMIVHGEALADVKDYVHDVIEDYQNGQVSLDDVGIPGGIGKKLDNYDTDTAQVRGAKYANLLLGTNFASGSKPKRLYLEGVHPDFFERVEDERTLDPAEDPLYGEFKREVASGDGVICFEYADQVPEEFEVDWDKMLDKTLEGPIARVLEALDISWEEVKSGQEQTGLGSFM